MQEARHCIVRNLECFGDVEARKFAFSPGADFFMIWKNEDIALLVFFPVAAHIEVRAYRFEKVSARVRTAHATVLS